MIIYNPISKPSLILGSTGMVGSALIREHIRQRIPYIGISSKDCDLESESEVNKLFLDHRNNIGTVYLAAAKVGGIDANRKYKANFILNNLKIQTNVIDAAHRYNVEGFIFFGSSCVYPNNISIPIAPEHIMTGPLEKTNDAYAVAKIAGIQMVNAYREQYNMNAFSVMPCNLYGPGDNYDENNSHVLAALIRKAYLWKKDKTKKMVIWGDGTPRREFLYVDTLARAVVCASQYNFPDNPIINIGYGSDISIKDIAVKILEMNGCDDPQNHIIFDTTMPNGTMRKLMDSSFMFNDFGWRPLLTLEQGLKLTIDDFEHRYGKVL